MGELRDKVVVISVGADEMGTGSAKKSDAGRVGNSEAVYFLASQKVGAITGSCLSVDFGITAGY